MLKETWLYISQNNGNMYNISLILTNAKLNMGKCEKKRNDFYENIQNLKKNVSLLFLI